MIEAKAVSKSFDGFLALNDLDMTVPKGSIYGLVGPNGAGKFSATCAEYTARTAASSPLRANPYTNIPPSRSVWW